MRQARATCILVAASLLAFALFPCASCSAPTPSPTPTLPPSPTPTLPQSPEDADVAYLTCCAGVWEGVLSVVDAIATAGQAADTDVFCEAQTEWGSSVRELRARHAECPRRTGSRLVAASGSLDVGLDELEQATGLYGEFCRTQDLHLAADANQQLQEAWSHLSQAYEALTGQSTAGPTPDDVNLAWVDCASDVMLDLWELFDDMESAPEVHSLVEFCAPIGEWAASLAGIEAEYALCTPPTDPCLRTAQESLEALLAEFSAAFQHYGEACAKDNDSLVEEGNAHLLDALAYLQQASEAVRQCWRE